jgi:hypothetical protein
VESDSTYRRCPSAYSMGRAASAGFPRARDARDDDEFVPGDRDADIFEVVLAGTLDDDIFHFTWGTDWCRYLKK